MKLYLTDKYATIGLLGVFAVTFVGIQLASPILAGVAFGLFVFGSFALLSKVAIQSNRV